MSALLRSQKVIHGFIHTQHSMQRKYTIDPFDFVEIILLPNIGIASSENDFVSQKKKKKNCNNRKVTENMPFRCGVMCIDDRLCVCMWLFFFFVDK